MAENVKVIFEGVDKFSGPVKSMGSALGGFTSTLAGVAGGLGVFTAASAVVGFASNAFIGLNSTLEQSEVAFGVMLGSAEAATAHLDELAAFAAKTPFEFTELIGASKRMQAYGFAAKDIVPILTSVSDAAAGTGGSVDSITLALGQMQTRGKASLGDLNQLTGQGIPIYQMLADTLGISVAEAQKKVTAGAVDMATVMEAFTTGVGSRYGGMAAKQSLTFKGAMSTVMDTLNMTMAKGFRPFFDLMTTGMVGLGAFLGGESFQAFAASVARGGEALAQIAVDAIPRFIDGIRSVASTVGDAISIVANMRAAIGGDVVAMADVVGAAMRLFGDGFARNLERVTGAVGDFLAYLRPGNTVDLMRAWFGADIGPRIDKIVRSFRELTLGVRLAFDDLRALVSGDIDFDAFWDFLKVDVGMILRSLGSIAGTLTTWVGDQIAAIDWTAAWGKAKATGQGLIDGMGNVAGDVTTWVGEQFEAVDWGAAWSRVTNIGAGLVAGLGSIVADVEAWVRGQFAGVSWAGVWGTVTGVGAGVVAGLGDIKTDIQTWVGEQFAGVSWEGIWSAVPSFDLPAIDTAPMVEALGLLTPAVDAMVAPMESLRDAVSPAASGLASFGEQAGLLAALDMAPMATNIGGLATSIADIGVNGPAATQSLVDLGVQVAALNTPPTPDTGIPALNTALAGIDPMVLVALPALAKLPPQILIVGAAVTALAIAWTSDFLGIQSTVTSFVGTFLERFPEVGGAFEALGADAEALWVKIRGGMPEVTASVTGMSAASIPALGEMGGQFIVTGGAAEEGAAKVVEADTMMWTNTEAAASSMEGSLAGMLASFSTSLAGVVGHVNTRMPEIQTAFNVVSETTMPIFAAAVGAATQTAADFVNAMGIAVKFALDQVIFFINFDWLGAWDNMVIEVRRDLANITTAVSGMVTDVKGILDGLKNTAQYGSAMIDGVVAGIVAKAGDLVAAARTAVEAGLKAIRDAILPGSPSRVTRPLGESLIQGLSAGMVDEARFLEGTIARLMTDARDAFGRYVSAILEVGPAQGDWLNDWLTHIPESLRGVAEDIGRYFHQIVENGDVMGDMFAALPTEIQTTMRAIGQHLVGGDRVLDDWAQQAGLAFGYIEEKLAGFGATTTGVVDLSAADMARLGETFGFLGVRVAESMVPATEALTGFSEQATSATTAAGSSIEATVASLDAALLTLAETTLPSLMQIYNTTQQSMDAATYEAVSSMIAGLQDLAEQGVSTFGDQFPAVFEAFYNQTLAQLDTLYRAAMGNMDVHTVEAVSSMIGEVQKFKEQAEASFAEAVPAAMVDATDAADLANVGISDAVGSLTESVEDRFLEILKSIEEFVKRVLALLASIPTNVTTTHTIVTNTVQGETYTQTTEPVATYAMGGIVPGPIGAPRLAVVHGGEEVLTPGQRGGRGRGLTINIHQHIAGSVVAKDDLIRDMNQGLRDFIRGNPEYNLGGGIQP